MKIVRLNTLPEFPPVTFANSEGLLAFGGQLEPLWIIEAYTKGIFPWYNEEDPILWWSPNPRSVIFLDDIKISKSMKKLINKNIYTIKFDNAFKEVMRACKETREDTWISEDFIKCYSTLHNMGIAHSIEVWENDELVGGLYGLSIGKMFFGESMFSKKSNTSKLALIFLVEYLKKNDYFLIDCQVHNSHLESMGAVEIPREKFLDLLEIQLSKKSLYEKWKY